MSIIKETTLIFVTLWVVAIAGIVGAITFETAVILLLVWIGLIHVLNIKEE